MQEVGWQMDPLFPSCSLCSTSVPSLQAEDLGLTAPGAPVLQEFLDPLFPGDNRDEKALAAPALPPVW